MQESQTNTQQSVPRGRWTMVLAGLGVFMVALDTMVVNTALPAMHASLHASLATLEWTVNAYLLGCASLMLTGAALGDRFGRRRMFVLGIGVFTAASAAAALAPNVGALIAARVAQGAGAAVAFPLSLTLISHSVPTERRGAAIGLWGAITGVAAAFGPVIGGALVSAISWHWIFWVNVPVGIAVIALAPARLRESYGPRPTIDVIGVLLAATGALAITWALVRSSAAGWGSAEVISALALGATLLAGFVAWERRAKSPMIAPELFRSRGLGAANAVSFFMFGGLAGALFMMTQLLQSAEGHSALVAGLLLLPWTIAPGFAAPIAGKLADRYGNRPFMAAGLALQAIGLGWIAAIARPGMSYLPLGLALTIAGFGIGLGLPIAANAALGSVPASEAGVASGTNSTMRQFGGVLGVALLATVFAGNGGYSSPQAFVNGFSPALWVAAGLSVLGMLAAISSPERQPRPAATSVPEPALALTGQG